MAHTCVSPRKRILIADDDDGLRGTLAECIADQGHFVETAPDGTSALAKLLAADFDMVITDVYMPGMTGLELLECIRRDNLSVVPVIMSSLCSPDVKQHARRHGAVEQLDKPFAVSRLMDIINTHRTRKGAGLQP
jgi:DNA-binding NtrC family response regulator